MNELQKSAPLAVGTIINQMQTQFAKVLPKIITPERFCRVVLSAINKNPTLAEALKDQRNQASVLSAFMRCAEMGLEPDGRRATINCYRKKNGGYDVTLIPMYQGLSELVMRSGLISTIHAEKICDKDEFVWDTGKVEKHKVNWREPRGDAYAYYCHVVFRDGTVKDETMSRDEVESIRAMSSGYQYAKKFGSDNPWISHFDEMAKKTVFRRCAKWLPLSPELRSAIEQDDDDYRLNAETVKFAVNDKFFASMQETADKQEEPPAVDVSSEPVTQEEPSHLTGNTDEDHPADMFGK